MIKIVAKGDTSTLHFALCTLHFLRVILSEAKNPFSPGNAKLWYLLRK